MHLGRCFTNYRFNKEQQSTHAYYLLYKERVCARMQGETWRRRMGTEPQKEQAEIKKGASESACSLEKKGYSGLDRSHYIPDEGTDADLLVAEVKFLDRLQERGHLFVLNDGDDTGVHLRPSVRTAAGFAAVGTTTLHLLEERKAFDTQYIQHIFDTAGIGLIEYDHNRFHNQLTIINYQLTKGSTSIVQRFKIRTFYDVCTKADRTLCKLYIVNYKLFLNFEVHEDEFLAEGFLFVAVAVTGHDTVEHRHYVERQESRDGQTADDDDT